MPKVVICHTPVIHNHYMECSAPKLPSLGCCCDSVCPRVSYSLARYSHFHIPSQTHRHRHINAQDISSVSGNMCCFFIAYCYPCLQLWLLLCAAIWSYNDPQQTYVAFFPLCQTLVFPRHGTYSYNAAIRCCCVAPDCHLL